MSRRKKPQRAHIYPDLLKKKDGMALVLNAATALFSLAVFLAVDANSASAQTSACEKSHIVRPGDNLSSLANRFFGDATEFPRFFEDQRNGEGLKDRPNQLAVGDTLYYSLCRKSDRNSKGQAKSRSSSKSKQSKKRPPIGSIVGGVAAGILLGINGGTDDPGPSINE